MKSTVGTLFFIVGELLAVDVAGGVLSGDARGLYLSQDREKGAMSAQGVSLNPVYSIRDDFLDFSVEVGAAAALSFSEELESFGGQNRFNSADKAGVTAAEALYLNRSNITFYNRSGYFKLGYQTLDTPTINSDGGRLTPTTFQALTYVNTATFPGIKVAASHIYGIRGWDTGGESGMLQALFANDTLGAEDNATNRLTHIGNHAVTALGIIFKEGGVRAQLWNYSMTDRTRARLSNADYGDKRIEIKPGDSSYGDLEIEFGDELVTIQLAYQYAVMGYHIGAVEGIGTAENFASLNQRLTGFKAEIAFSSGFFLTTATNSVEIGKNSLSGHYINGWGGYPEFAVADEYRLNRFDNRRFSTIKSGLGFREGDVALGVSLTQYSGDKEQGADAAATITDAIFTYRSLSAAYEVQDVYKSVDTGDNTYSTLVKIEMVKKF